MYRMVNKRGLFAFSLIRLFVVQGTTILGQVVLIVDGKGCKEGGKSGGNFATPRPLAPYKPKAVLL